MWSEPKAGPQDADGVVADLHATLAAAGISGPLVLVCHSLGGPYIMNYTKKYGEEVKGLVFVDCSHPDQLSRLPPKIAATIKTPFLYRVLSALSWTGISHLLPDTDVPGMPERIKPVGKAYLGETIGGSLKEMDGIEATFRESGELRTLGDRPLVVLAAMQPIPEDMLAAMSLTPQDGVDMQAVWKVLSADAASWSTHSRLELVPDSLHYIQFQRPDLVIQAVNEVVDAVRAEELLTGR
jgi:pimeloyl-ACP methyl ester carboxylesterase